MLSKEFMHYLSGLEQPEKRKENQKDSSFDTKPLFYIILKNVREEKKA